MGATPWSLFGPYHGNARAALRLAQAEFFEQNYDLASVLKERIDSTLRAVRATEKEDEYALLETYRESLRRLRRLQARPLPKAIHRQIELLRRIEAEGASDIGNILDLRGVAATRQEGMLCPLSKGEMRTLFGTDRPTRWQSEQALWKIYRLLGRGEAVGFPVFRAREPREPAGWFFVGYSVD
jgi:hypothetical protein